MEVLEHWCQPFSDRVLPLHRQNELVVVIPAEARQCVLQKGLARNPY